MFHIHRAGLGVCRSCRAAPSSPCVYEISRYSSGGGRSNPLRFRCVTISQSHFLRHGISANRDTRSRSPNLHSLLPLGLSVGRDVVSRPAESLSLSSLSGVLEVRLHTCSTSSPATIILLAEVNMKKNTKNPRHLKTPII